MVCGLRPATNANLGCFSACKLFGTCHVSTGQSARLFGCIGLEYRDLGIHGETDLYDPYLGHFVQ